MLGIPETWQKEIDAGTPFGIRAQKALGAMSADPRYKTTTRNNRNQTTSPPLPHVSTIGSRILDVVERELGVRLSCGSCIQYITNLNTQTEHDHTAIVNKLAAELPMPIEYRQRVTHRHKRLSEVIAHIVPPPNSDT